MKRTSTRASGAIMALSLLFTGTITAQIAGNWTRQVPSNFPPARVDVAMAYDSARSQVVIFGGSSGSVNNETWTWDGSNWTHKSPLNSPSPRAGTAMVYDSTRGQIVLFGGGDSNGDLGDTWVWDGSNWTQKSPQNSPQARVYHAMSYDAARKQVVLFGGLFSKDNGASGSVVFGDTWTWDGSNWTQQTPQPSPALRLFHAMAYDSAHGQTVLFGGNLLLAGMVLANDTWTWDGSNWTQKSPQNNPPPRATHAMAYDSAHGYVILFGGAQSGTTVNVFSDTWTWDGSNWTQKSPQNTPPARNFDALAYDSAHGQVLMFGGNNPSIGILGDTWTWDGGSVLPNIGGVVSASGFGGFTSVAPGSWVEIYGSNLAPHQREWAGPDFAGNNAPTSLDGVQVTIGGQKAFVDFISSGQVNAQLPSNIGTGPAQITLTNGNLTSAPFNITVNATQPGLLAPPSFKIGANQYVVAQFGDGTYVLPTGAIATVPSRPAKPGETIVIFGVGFGPVTPVIPAGQIVTQINSLSTSLQVQFGQTQADLKYFGLTPNFVGLYQFNVVVPAVPDNDLVPLTFKLGGVAGTQTLFVPVHQ